MDTYQDESDDELFKELEADDDHLMDRMREQRMSQLKRELAYQKKVNETRYGIYETITSEKQVMLATTNTAKCVIHFGHKDFRRCHIMDKHLAIIARKHPDTKFIRVDVENVPFLVEKMDLKVLPCIISFIDGIGVDRLLGFEGVSEKDEFNTWELEKRLALNKVIELEKIGKIIKFAEPEDSDDD
ncbi:thioredoxin-like protein [Globomyces pollinis-pini]|nr:thioredoxin-like protein [Globomyces pollinis-pini]